MKALFSLLTVVCSFAVFAQKEPVEVANGYKIEIQTSAICEMCQHAIEYGLTFEKGVKDAVLNLDNKMVTVIYNPRKTTPKKIRERITKVGYHADDMKRDSIMYENLPACCKDGAHGTYKKDH